MVDGAGSAWLCLSHREWVEDTQLWIQQVSSTPSTRMDVVHLQEQLDLKLQQRQARETGICPVRRELYSQCFGEWLEREATPPSTASFPFPSVETQALSPPELSPSHPGTPVSPHLPHPGHLASRRPNLCVSHDSLVPSGWPIGGS